MGQLLVAIIVLFGTHLLATVELNAETNNKTSEIENEIPSKVLSRRKRFLVFPDGSSFQLVFCTQNQGYLHIGDIVWFGNTAALAWELPSDPQLFYKLKKHTKFYGNRRIDDNKHILYLDEDGKVIGKVPYRRRPIVNPAFAKRSVNGETPKENNVTRQLSIRDMHEKEMKTNRFHGMEANRVEFHRESRTSLYGKIEKILEGFGWNGRECVLRLLCETGKGRYGQGTFLEEVLRATFTLPKGRQFESRVHKEYDIAHGNDGDCTQIYPDCRTAPK